MNEIKQNLHKITHALVVLSIVIHGIASLHIINKFEDVLHAVDQVVIQVNQATNDSTAQETGDFAQNFVNLQKWGNQ